MKKIVGFTSIVLVLVIVVAAPGYAISGVIGKANTDNTILSVRIGNTVVKLATDMAESLNTSSLKAVGQFVTGQVGDATLPGSVSRTATKSSENGSASIGSGTTKSVPGLASVKLQGGRVAASVAKTKVHSAVDFAVGQVNALDGFASIGTTSSSTDSSVGVNSSTVSRDVSIGKVSVLNLRDLLNQLGIDPLAMACAAVQSTGAALGVDTSSACATLTSVNNQITSVTGEIGTTGTVITTLATVLAPLCAAAPAGTCTTVDAQISALQADITNFQADPATACATMDQAVATITADANTVVTTLNGLSGGALPDLTAIIAPVASQLGSLSTATTTLDSTCNTLLGIVNSLLDTPLLSLDLIKVNMDLEAKSNPSAIAKGAIGSLKVGNLTVVSANDLVALGSQLNSAIASVQSALGSVLSATGLGLHAPSLDLLKVTTHKGRNSAGSYFADGAMTVAHLGVPSAVVNLPSSLPFGSLAGLGSFAPAAVHVAAVTTPSVSVDAGVFSGSATFKGGKVLAVTGVADSGLMFAGMLCLIGAGLVRRVSKVF